MTRDPRPHGRLHGQIGPRRVADLPLDPALAVKARRLQPDVTSPETAFVVFRPDVGRAPAPSLTLGGRVRVDAPRMDALEPTRPVAFEHDGATWRAQIRFPLGTSFYGTGEVPGPLLRNGRAARFWNTDAWRYGEGTPALYQSHPYVLAVRPDGVSFGVLADSVRRGEVVIADDGIEFAFEEEPFDVHVFGGGSPLAATAALSALLGPPASLPRFALGYHQCRWSYNSAKEVRELASEFRRREIPCDVIWLDIDYMDRFRCFTWDPERFAEPARLIADLHAMNFSVVAMLDPGLAADPAWEVCRSGLERDVFVKDRDGKPFVGRVWPGPCHFPDFTTERARSWWAERVEAFVRDSGVDGIWNDMNEPSVFRTPTHTLPEDARHEGFGGGDHRRFHNVYGSLMAEATRDGLLRARPDARPFVLTRAGHLGAARVAATWTGDNQASWTDLKWSIAMTLNLGLSGQPFAGPDVGGFDGDPSPDLFARWFELAAYLPFCRGHGEKGSCRKEPWSFGPEVEARVKAALERRMALLPTLERLAHDAVTLGHPVVRPVFFADPTDLELRAVDDAFLLGADLLVAPIVEPDSTARRVRLPRGTWFRFGGTERVEGGREIEVAGPPGSTPVFVRAGAVVATTEPRTHTKGTPPPAITRTYGADAPG